MKRYNRGQKPYNYESFTNAVVKWLAGPTFNIVGSDQQSHLARCILQKYHTILLNRGAKEAIRFCKESREALYQWLATVDSMKYESRSGSILKLPSHLYYLKRLSDIDYPSIRLALSALYVSRGLELPVSPNISSITGPPLDWGLTEIDKYTKDFWLELGVRGLGQNPRSVYWKKFHLSTKMGPNGHSLWSSVADLTVMPATLIESVGIIGGKRLASRMSLLAKYFSLLLPFFKVIGKRYRKIAAIPSYEGKTREVAMLDYWSQTALRGLHQYLFRQLKRIPQDCTFDQGSFKEKLKWDSDEPFYSVDLTAATDRFPISLIESVLKARFTDDYVNHWRNIMVGYPFWTKEFGEIRYSVGNPMGAYSSWNSFALSHHYVMYYCCRELGMNWRKAAYVLLGDDIVIHNTVLANKYMETLSRLGVQVSANKTHVSKHMYEFAKRVFHTGTEVTPFPIAALWTTRNTPSLMMNVLVGEERKGWLSPIGTPAALSELYQYLGFSRTYRSRLSRILDITYHIMVAIGGRMTATEALQPMLVKYYPKISDDPNIGKLLLMRTLEQSFRSSSDPGKGGEPLGLTAEQLVCLITGDEDAAIDAIDLIQSVAVLQVHGQIEEMYLKAMKSGPGSAFASLVTSDWKTALRALTIPISDRVYYSRNQDIMVQASFSLAKIWMRLAQDEVSARSLIPSFTDIENLFASFSGKLPG